MSKCTGRTERRPPEKTAAQICADREMSKCAGRGDLRTPEQIAARRRWVRSLLEKGQLTQREIGDLVGLGPATIQNISAQMKADAEPKEVPAYTCPTCKHRVKLRPCQICRTRRVGSRFKIPESHLTEEEERQRQIQLARLSGDPTPEDVLDQAAELREQRGPLPDALEADWVTRARATREEVEARLDLFHATIRDQLAAIADGADPAIVDQLDRVATWLEGERENFMQDLFRRPPIRRRDSEREPLPDPHNRP